ncbi:MAG: iron-containing alcohol dehydrogenase [Geminicoccaceae bacterium]|nr:iron-containing alcohol dehydrogenase [Geminicoccaceae bacterium]MCS7268896.1 iron-containing alcohol dehydrogenase [Geminicoccaceae bacterium]MCX7629569.1 iron-containing alcohol dehydrogenase [Geminicoccaceae bacterium]MDW8125182.1 iron-containing alcohol dehydrogenase [Geminicoccaceae bacterium]MDW8342002.1 iron-containing alcohol dehydrogenase [Geminicoccaceae bacterium]
MSDLAALVTTWTYPTRIRFGVGTVRELAEICREAGIARPLVVTDANLARRPLFEQVLAPLREAGLAFSVFDGVRPNPTAANVEEGVERLRAGGHDGVVAVGGGSALDVGKLVAFMVAQSRPIWDFEDVDDHWRRARTQGIRPVVAIPTTAGTGSEVGRAGVVTDEASRTKKVVFHPGMMPRTAILDPALTTGLPPQLTAATGMDALAHALEAYCAPAFHPMAEGIAVEAVRLIFEALPEAVRDGANLEARAKMLAASAMGAAAFQKGLGAVHALSHPLGAVYDLHHGLLNGVLLPYVLAFNRPAIEAKIARLSAWLGLEPRFEAFLRALLDLRARIGIPGTLAAAGVPEPPSEELARAAERDPTASGNPRPVDARALARLYRCAFEGNLPEPEAV